jgi:hypothetical protein
MDQRKVKSREYKIMLRASEFGGDEDEVLEQAGRFWTDFTDAVDDDMLRVGGTLDKIAKRRLIRFYDTRGHRLRKNGYVFRERVDIDDSDREATLKFRHPDRYLAQDRNMSARKKAKGKTKFEEDIKPPSTRLFSFSTTQEIGNETLNKMDDPGDLYPDLKHQLDEYHQDEELFVVGEYTATELVIKKPKKPILQIGEDPDVIARAALVVWHDADGSDEVAEVAEFSYRYGDEKEQYRGAPAKRAHDILMTLQSGLGPWVDPASKTKTGFVYDRAHNQARRNATEGACTGQGCGPPRPAGS